MARANPNSSFEAAVKHLLRHLHDAQRLRENPLARPFFTGPSSVGADRSALARLHCAFRAAAERARDADLAAGKRERSRRQYALAIGCLDRAHAGELARDLGIASSQCYRERAEIGLRIARDLRAGIAVAEPFDDFRYGLDRAASIAEFGDPDRAIEEYERLRRRAVTAAQAIEATCELALVHLRKDARAQADAAIAQARALLEGTRFLAQDERALAGAHLTFATGMTTWPRDPSGALALFSQALAALERANLAGERARELRARILFEYGEGLTTFQDMRASILTLRTAAGVAASCRPSPVLALKADIMMRLFRNSILDDPCGWQPLAQRMFEIQELARRAHASGSVDLSLRALNAIAQIEAVAGNGTASLAAARSALALSKYQPTAEIFSEIAVRMARTIMYSPLWREVPALLRDAGPPATVAVAASRRTLEAEYALRTGDYARAGTILASHDTTPRPYMRVLAAQTAYALGSPRDARRLLESALPAIEQSGIALTMERTYRVAARVNGDRRMAGKADEIARAMTA